MTKIAKQLRSEMSRLGLSAPALAKRAKLSTGTIYNLLGRTNVHVAPTLTTINALRRAGVELLPAEPKTT